MMEDAGYAVAPESHVLPLSTIQDNDKLEITCV